MLGDCSTRRLEMERARECRWFIRLLARSRSHLKMEMEDISDSLVVDDPPTSTTTTSTKSSSKSISSHPGAFDSSDEDDDAGVLGGRANGASANDDDDDDDDIRPSTRDASLPSERRSHEQGDGEFDEEGRRRSFATPKGVALLPRTSIVVATLCVVGLVFFVLDIVLGVYVTDTPYSGFWSTLCFVPAFLWLALFYFVQHRAFCAPQLVLIACGLGAILAFIPALAIDIVIMHMVRGILHHYDRNWLAETIAAMMGCGAFASLSIVLMAGVMFGLIRPST